MNNYIQVGFLAIATELFLLGNFNVLAEETNVNGYSILNSSNNYSVEYDISTSTGDGRGYNGPHTRAEEIEQAIQEELEEQIAEEIRLGEKELLAQLSEAEAGNQDMKGKRLVGDVVMNRCRKFGKSVEEIIFMKNQFSCIKDGGFDRAAWHISEESFEAARLAYDGYSLDRKILYFTAGSYNPYCKPMYKYGDHYFGS